MSVDPKRVFTTAEVYRASAQVLSKFIANGMPHYMFPMVTCSAFSLELYLKCLILIEGNESEKSHDLERLFSSLAGESQIAIRTNYQKCAIHETAKLFAARGMPPHPSTDFDFVLHASASAFENFRYAYEGIRKNPAGWMADPIRDCVRERILESYRDWENLPYGFGGPLLPPGI